jgi:hypothetical protein
VGLRAMFKGLGSMFRSKGNGFKPRQASPSRSTVVKTEKAKPVEPPKPPEPKKCSVQLVNSPQSIGFDPIEMNIRLDCPGGASPAGQELEVVVGWKDDKTPIKRRVRTDAAGQARILLEVNGVEKDSERQFDDLDRYDRELRERAEREALTRESDRSGLTSASSGVALEKAKEVVTAPHTAIAIRAVPGVMLLGVEIGAAAAATGGVAIVGASTYLTYQRMKADVERQVAKDESAYAKGTAELKSRIGSKFDDLDKHAREARAEDGCGDGQPVDILDRFVDGTRLAPGFLRRHEDNGGHTIDKHVGKPREYLIARLKEVWDASSYNDMLTAENVTRQTIIADLDAITAWFRSKDPNDRRFRNPGGAGLREIGYMVSRDNYFPTPKFDSSIVLRKAPQCRILIYTSFPE